MPREGQEREDGKGIDAGEEMKRSYHCCANCKFGRFEKRRLLGDCVVKDVEQETNIENVCKKWKEGKKC